MTKIQNTENNEKMAEYCKTCICKSCEQVAWLEPETAKLKTENERLATAIEKIAKIVEGTYEVLDPQALQEIRQIIKEQTNEK